MKQKQIHQKITLEKLKEIIVDSYAVSINDMIYLTSPENDCGELALVSDSGDEFDLNSLTDIYLFKKGYFRAMFKNDYEVVITPLYVRKM